MKNSTRTLLLLLGDILMFGAAFFLMLIISFPGKWKPETIHLHLLPFSIMSIIWIGIFFVFNLYNPQVTKPTIPNLRQIGLAFIIACIVGIIFFYTIPFFNITPKTNLLIFSGTMFVLFIGWRRIFYAIFASYFRRRVVFIVSSNHNTSLVEDIKNYITINPQSGFILSGMHETLEEFYSHNPQPTVEVLIVSKEIWTNPTYFQQLQNTQNEVLDLAYAYENILGRIPLEAIDEGWFMHNIHSYQEKINTILEKLLGIVFAIIALIATSPFLVLSIFLIKLERNGTIFYSQARVGKNGKNFKLYKLRSMVMGAEQHGAMWCKGEDARITRVGKIIRKLHFDEIPQMWNIIKGDIALVGPRPERPEFVAELEKQIPFYYLRHAIIPGFTGWAQIKFRYAGSIMDSKEKFEYDLYYIKNRNIFMDFGIILRTIQIIFTH